jgi:ABC-type xylose transport system permease subunit
VSAGSAQARAAIEAADASRERLRSWAETFGILVVALLVLLLFAATSNLFLRPANLTNILIQISVVGVAAIGSTIVLLSGSIDLSVGGVVLLGAVVIGDLAERQGLPLPVAIAGGLVASTLVGVLSGVLVAVLRVEARSARCCCQPARRSCSSDPAGSWSATTSSRHSRAIGSCSTCPRWWS